MICNLMFACWSRVNIRHNSDKPGGIARSWAVEFKSPHYFRFNEERKKIRDRQHMPAEISMNLFFNCIREKKKSLTWHWSGIKLKQQKRQHRCRKIRANQWLFHFIFRKNPKIIWLSHFIRSNYFQLHQQKVAKRQLLKLGIPKISRPGQYNQSIKNR